MTATPLCRAPVADLSVQPRYRLTLDPAAAAETEYAVVDAGGVALSTWGRAAPIQTDGSSGGGSTDSPSTFAKLRAAYPAFAGFAYRLRDNTSVTASCIWQMELPGHIVTVAGTGARGFGGDGGAATNALLSEPDAVAVDSRGNLYIADRFNCRIRRVDAASGTIATVAGKGTCGSGGDGGPAAEAEVNFPRGVAVDSRGNLYIADTSNRRIRRVDAASRTIAAFAGTGVFGNSGDGGPAIEALLNQPVDVTVDGRGNLYFVDLASRVIRKVDAGGTITTVAGPGILGSRGDGGPATEASMRFPEGMAVDSRGNLYIADTGNHRIRRVDAASGIITTVAGTGTQGYSGDGGPATEARLNRPSGVAVDSRGNLYIADKSNHRIRRVRMSAPSTNPNPNPDPQPPGGGGGGSGGGRGGSGGGGGAPVAPEPPNRAPEATEEIADAGLGAGAALAIDLSDCFDDPDGDDLSYRAGSSDENVATVEVDGDTLTVRGLARGTAQVTVTATDGDGETVSQDFAVTVTAPEAVWYLPPATDAARQGFVRVLNHSDVAGKVTVTATDDAGRTYDPLSLALGLRGVAAFNADDLENGNADKGLTGATGMGEGGWRLRFDSDALDVEALAYIRTADGFVTGMNATAPRGADGALEIATFNPASNVDQVSLLRLVNPGTEAAGATVTGVDDAGASPGRPVRLTLPAGSACTVDAAQLESGGGLACGSPQAGLGDGAGKWRLTVASDEPLVAMSLLSSPAGHLTNLSAKARADAGGMWHVDLFPAASDALGRQGFVRVANRASVGGAATIEVNDDGDTRYETLRLDLEAGETVHINSDDLETGNRSKGLTGSTGAGMGTWRLRLHSGVDIEANAYVRTPDGFLTAMQARAPRAGSAHRVAFLNPGSNERQVGVLRLVNRSSGAAAVSIDGTDERGLRPGTTVRVAVPATDAVELTAAELESGAHAAIESGALGDGAGKWRLRVDGPVTVLSLLSSPGGRLTNLSHADGARGLGALPAALLPAPETVTLTSPADRQLRGRWSAVEGARYDVDLLRDGVWGEHSSLTRARSTSFRWTDRLPGAYMIRVCSVNEDRLRGPCRESEEVEID